MLTKFVIEADEKAPTSEVIVTLKNPLNDHLKDLVDYVANGTKAVVNQQEDGIELKFIEPRLAFSVINAVIDRLVEAYIKEGRVYDEKGRIIQRPIGLGKGKLHKLQKPSDFTKADVKKMPKAQMRKKNE